MVITQDIARNLFEYRDNKLFWKKPTRKQDIGKVAGYIRPDGYVRIKIEGKLYYGHRIIFIYYNGYLPKFIDHIDGNPRNNNINNLREASRCQNSYNSKIAINNKSGVKGVSWHKKASKWMVCILANSKVNYLGLYDHIEDAKKVALDARKELHGEFANSGDDNALL